MVTFEVFDRLGRARSGALAKRFSLTVGRTTVITARWRKRFSGEFAQYYLVLQATTDGQARAVQPLFFVEQDLTVSLGASVRAVLRPLRRWLKLRLMMVGCIVGDGQIGVPELAEVPAVVPALDEALERFARRAAGLDCSVQGFFRRVPRGVWNR